MTTVTIGDVPFRLAPFSHTEIRGWTIASGGDVRVEGTVVTRPWYLAEIAARSCAPSRPWITALMRVLGGQYFPGPAVTATVMVVDCAVIDASVRMGEVA